MGALVDLLHGDMELALPAARVGAPETVDAELATLSVLFLAVQCCYDYGVSVFFD